MLYALAYLAGLLTIPVIIVVVILAADFANERFNR